MSEHAENTFMNTFNRAFVADPVVALEMVESMTGDLMKSIEEKRKAGIKEADPQMVKLQEDHAYLTGLYEDKTEELALHRRAQEAMGISSDFQPNPFEAALGVEEDGFVFFDAPEEPAQKATSPAAVKAAVSDDVLSNDDLAVMAKKTQQLSQTAAANTQGVDISSFEADEPDLSELDRFTVRKAEGRPQDEPEAPKQHIDELEAYTKKKQQSSGVSSMAKRISEMFKAKSHAPVCFVEEEQIKRMFGNTITKIVKGSDSRSIHFNDKSILKEEAQGLSIETKDRTMAARRLTLMAVAKGWNSITFEGNQLFLEQAYEEATRAGLVVKPTTDEQARIFKDVHEARKLDTFMPYGGKKEDKKKDIDKDIENPGFEQHSVPVKPPVFSARLPTRVR